MWGNGCCKPRNLEAGTSVAGEVNPMMQFCFATETRELAKHILGREDKPGGMERKKGASAD